MGFTKLHIIEADGSLTDYTNNETAVSQLTTRLMDHMGVVNCLFTQ